MIRGFLVGSLALVALEVFVRRADQAGALFEGLVGGVARVISPQVGGVPNLVARRTAATAPAAGSSSSAARNVVVAPFAPAAANPTGPAGLADLT